jgi:hypothetical protein
MKPNPLRQKLHLEIFETSEWSLRIQRRPAGEKNPPVPSKRTPHARTPVRNKLAASFSSAEAGGAR